MNTRKPRYYFRKLYLYLYLHRIIVSACALLLVGVGSYYFYVQLHNSHRSHHLVSFPEYLSFTNSYVYTVPKDFNVDELSIPGFQLIYAGTLTAKTLDESYDQGIISVQSITDLHAHSTAEFKTYINQTILPMVSKNLSSSYQLTYSQIDDYDIAYIEVNKDNKIFRELAIKNGLHPAVIIGHENTTAFKNVAQSLVDTENSDLKTEVEPIKAAIKNSIQTIKLNQPDELYKQATAELRSKSPLADVTSALKSASIFMQKNITIRGGAYDGKEFAVVLDFERVSKEAGPAIGSLHLKKEDDKWKLNGLQLPATTFLNDPPSVPAKK